MRLALSAALLLLVVPLFPAPAQAEELRPLTLDEIFRLLGEDFTIPTEWSGIWSTTDTVRDCGGALISVDAGLDTLCTGMGLDSGAEDLPVELSCSGTVTPTSVDVTCTGEYDPIPDCTASITSTTTGTRTDDTYVVTATVMIDYSGPGFGCDQLPDQCLTVVTRGTRVDPEPTAYCDAVQVIEGSWGKVKSTYR